MSDEITASGKLSFAKDNDSDAMVQALKSFTMTGRDWIKRTQAITNSAGGEALDIGEITTCGWAFFYHTGMDESAVVVVDTISLMMGTGGAAFVKLKPGEFALLRLAASTPYAIASSTGLPKLNYMILED